MKYKNLRRKKADKYFAWKVSANQEEIPKIFTSRWRFVKYLFDDGSGYKIWTGVGWYHRVYIGWWLVVNRRTFEISIHQTDKELEDVYNV